jgi:hypothetical protein
MKTYDLSGGEITLWSVSGSSVMLKLNTRSTDPIELGEGEVEELISILKLLLKDASGEPG